ncbi:hypothetical protein SAMN02745245_00332 [Anaerosphaera aminiphila DSM 21120]|uniref:HEAT repeat-containing protein n=1 Tax=Anaerosphaera aminiphila DSM 21120 TaxID=1120995 RepID=A0A1M5PHY1_9FIRM|nr:hypothetical protein [Anaerosphaera aminiphila]SHH01301.1 hypothetical protein SAMN02745245_00332 [Anaerosphaera aminiphila DSM 21120]
MNIKKADCNYLKTQFDSGNYDSVNTYLLHNSNLPGKRANLTLMQSFSEVISTLNPSEELYNYLTSIFNSTSNGNDENTMLVICGLIGLGNFYNKNSLKKSEITTLLIQAMNDSRWRVREIVTESLKIIAINSYSEFQKIIDSMSEPTLLEQRAIIATLAHPIILKTNSQIEYSLRALDIIFKNFSKLDSKKDIENYKALKKGLSFAPSVIVAAGPVEGFDILKKYININKSINSAIKENLKKSKLLKYYPEEIQKMTALFECKI